MIFLKHTVLLPLLPVVLVLSCGTAPAPADPPPEEAAPAVVAVQPAEPAPEPPPAPAAETPPVEEPPAEEVFNPETISEETFTAAKTDVQTLIADLNGIIRARDYNAWTAHLSGSYMEKISSREFLELTTEELYRRDQIVDSNLGKDPRRTQKKILRTPRDYFTHLVVPSRSNLRMDDIEFVSQNRVKAYSLNSRGQRDILYDLEMIGNEWKIIN